jgi:hypothetical protein
MGRIDRLEAFIDWKEFQDRGARIERIASSQAQWSPSDLQA